MRPLVFLLYLLSFNVLTAQEHLAFTPIVNTNGLSENRVRNINELTDGRMVVVTEGMIQLYNGSHFKNIHINEESLIPLGGYTGFHHTYVEGSDRLWLKDQGKLMLIDLKKEQFENHPEKVLKELGITGPLSDFFMDTGNNLWFVTRQDKLIYRDKKSGRAKVFLQNLSKLTSKQDVLYDLAVEDEKLYLFYRSGSLLIFDLKTGAKKLNTPPNPDIDKLYNKTLFVVQHGRSLLHLRNGSGGGLMLNYDTGTGKWTTILKTSYSLNCHAVKKDGNIWLSCKNGLWIIDKDLKQKNFIPTLQLVDGRSIDTEVSTLFIDQQQGLWLGTLNRGLLYHHPDRFKFRNIGKSLFGVAGNKELLVNSISENNKGETLFGTSQGLFIYSKENVLKKYPQGLGNIPINVVYKDQSDRIWAGTSSGLYVLEDGAQLRFRANVSSIFQAKDGTFYLCTRNEGWGRFDLSTLDYKQISTSPHIGPVWQLIEWKGQLIGISGTNLFIYDPKSGKATFPDKLSIKPAMFRHSNHLYNSLFADSRGLLWFGTGDGLNVWNEKEEKLISFFNTAGSVSGNIKSIVEDQNHTIWVSTSNAVASIKVNSLKNKLGYSITTYNKFDGLIEGEFLERSSFITKDSRLLIGGIDGFNEINTVKISSKPVQLNPVFTGFELFGKPVKTGNEYSDNTILRDEIAQTKELNLNYNQNFFSIGFSGLNYINPAQTYYLYKLEGVDRDWQEIVSADGTGKATYTDLSPGTYTFKVMAAANKANWGKPALLTINIRAPWWNTILARIVFAASLLLLIWWLLKYYIQRSKNKLQAEQKAELDEMKFNFFTNISHEIRTPLTLILAPLEAILKKTEPGELRNRLEGIHRNGLSLMNLVTQLLDFRRLETDAEKLSLSYCLINEFVEQIAEPFKALASEKDIVFELTVGEQIYSYADKDKLGKVINNLLSNAFKFTPAGGLIKLNLEKNIREDKPELVIRVSDTGKGIPEEDQKNIFDRFFQASNQTEGAAGTGIGLHLVQEYVKLHRGSVAVESVAGKGSTFIISIPTNLMPETQITPAQIIESAASGLKILVVEDNAEFLNFLCGQLQESYTIITSTNGQEALEKVREHQPGLIITDLMMPVMNGLELCAAIRKDLRISHIPVILLTARSAEDIQKQGYEAGADAFISKPFNCDILLVRIQKILEQQERRKAMFKKALVIEADELTSSPADARFIQKAVKCVEQNMDDFSYSVEQFSSEMNMDRTGLYRKLVSITGQTPSNFIRAIRLKKAAQLICQKEFSITQISDMVGFSSAAYFSKCFQEEFGVKPSQFSKNAPRGSENEVPSRSNL